MAHSSGSKRTPPPAVQQSLTVLGGQIGLARKRRRLTMEEMASRMFVTRKTLSRLEKGEGGVTLAVLASALWVLGMDKALLRIADPASDEAGMFMERQRVPQRVRSAHVADRLDF